jgi:hypothetical protein
MTNEVTVGIEAVLQLREAELWATKCDWANKWGSNNWELVAAWSSVSDLLKDLNIKPLEPYERQSLGLSYV